MTREEKKEELIGLFSIGAIFIGDLIDECFELGQQHPHWISVEDELPKKETEVLMVSSGLDGILYGYRCKNGKYGWYCYDDDNYWHNITHWMPLPAPPKEIKGNLEKISPNRMSSSESPNNCKTKGGVI